MLQLGVVLALASVCSFISGYTCEAGSLTAVIETLRAEKYGR